MVIALYIIFAAPELFIINGNRSVVLFWRIKRVLGIASTLTISSDISETNLSRTPSSTSGTPKPRYWDSISGTTSPLIFRIVSGISAETWSLRYPFIKAPMGINPKLIAKISTEIYSFDLDNIINILNCFI